MSRFSIYKFLFAGFGDYPVTLLSCREEMDKVRTVVPCCVKTTTEGKISLKELSTWRLGMVYLTAAAKTKSTPLGTYPGPCSLSNLADVERGSLMMR